MRIVLTGGGTGGHLFPLITVAKKIREKVPGTEFIFIGPKGKLEEEVMKREGVASHTIMTGKIRRYFSIQTFFDMLKIPFGIIKSLWLLLYYMPDAVFSKGGYASVPVVLAAWAYRIPVLIHESDSNPGMANSMLAKFVDRVAVSYPSAQVYFPADQVVMTGNPVRQDITQGDASRARERYHLAESKKVIFVVGGSQGARSINNKILHILPQLLHKYQIIHQTGDKNIEEVKRIAGELGIKAGHDSYYPVAFYGEEIKDILAVASLVISRAGANTISEIAAVGKPAILIPLDSAANDHQRMNAYALAKNGGCLVLEEKNLGENILLQKIEEVLESEELQAKMANGIKAFYHPDASDRLADGILGMIN